MSSTRAVIVNVERQPGANVIAVVDSIKALLPQLRDTLPNSLDVTVLTDRTLTIRASVHDVQIELGFAVALVVAVIFLFLGDWRATLIPSLSVPLSLIGTLAVMYLAGFSLNNLSIIALTIATGFVVDDAILIVVCRAQPLTLIVAIGTVVLTVLLYVVIPKGFFPIQDNGLIQAVTEAPQSISFEAMGERQRALADVILNDPDVESLTSFVGVDGTNPTLNSGRMLINLKPRSQRSATASEIIRRLQRDTQSAAGVQLFMQPSQDLTLDSTVSRTQYQFVLESPNPDDFDVWVPRLVERMNRIPQIVDVAAELQNKGLSMYIKIYRDATARIGITPATIAHLR